MMKIIQITDTHLVPPPEKLFQLDPSARLERTLGHVRETQADADLLVITGDLANDGDPLAYRRLRALLEPMPMPVRLLLGNHDRRENFRESFPDHPVDPDGFIQSVMDVPGGPDRLIFLDSLREGEVGGRFCERRAAWLRARLAEIPGRPVTVFIHHPPVPHGMAHFDRIGLYDTERLLDVLDGHDGRIRYFFFGHIHIPLNGVTAAGTGYHSGRGSSHQFRQEFDNPRPDWIDGPLNYDIIRISPERISIHGCDTIDSVALARPGSFA